MLAFAGLGGFLFLNTLYLQDVRGLSPFEAGLYTLPHGGHARWSAAPLSGRLDRQARPARTTRPRRVRDHRERAMLTRLAPGTSVAYLFGAYFLFGLGFGLINPPITDTAVAGMPPSQAGVAAGVASTSRQVGQTLGVAVLGSLAAGGISGALGVGFASATHVAWWIVAVLGVVMVVLGVLTTSAWARGTARKTASRFGEARPQPLRAGEPVSA